jgi:uncharacterized ferritin-like protein (DUF455 family)
LLDFSQFLFLTISYHFIGLMSSRRFNVQVLERIYKDELTHVAKGLKWFKWLCERDSPGEEPHAM